MAIPADREVVIFPDNDSAGLQAASAISKELQNIASSCLVVDPKVAGLPEKWDLADPIPQSLDIRSLLLSSKLPELTKHIDKQIGALPQTNLSAKQKIAMLEAEVTAKLKADGKDSTAYQEQVKAELAIIDKTGFADDFIIASNIAKYCQYMNIATGQGRGSAVSSLVAYGLGIHQVDPIEHKLLFERFLSEKTTKNPDFDFDIAASQKILVENYLCTKYDNAAKLSIVAKDAEVKAHPSGIGIIPETIKAKLAPEYLTRIAGRFWEDRPCLKIDHKAAETLGVKKFDLLSSHVVEAIAKIEALTKNPIDWKKIGWHDSKTFELIKSGNTDNLYQLGSDFAKEICSEVKIENFSDIVNLLALIRPSSKKYVGYFASNTNDYTKDTSRVDRKTSGELAQRTKVREHKRDPKFDAATLEVAKVYSKFSDPQGIFKDTRGVPLFQEQIMQAASGYLGLDRAETNDFRRELEKEQSTHPLTNKIEFIKAATSQGLSGQDATHLYELLKEASKFGFNKSHAVAYAQMTFKTAYLKTHHPELFNQIFKVKE